MPGLLINTVDLVNFNINKSLDIGKIPYSKDNIYIILLVNQYQFDNINALKYGHKRVNYIKSKYFKNNVYGYYYVVYNEENKIIEIREHIHNPDHLREVVYSIRNYLPKDITVWTGLIPQEQTDNYINIGFNSPYICQKSPLKHKFQKKGIAFFKTNITEEPESNLTVKNNLLYVTQSDNKNLCKIYAKFTQQTVDYLKKINDPEQKNEKELSGSLTVSKIDKKGNKFIVELSKDTKSVISGVEEEVDAVWSRYNFHTHPKKAYTNNGVKRGWPSSQDYVAFIDLNNHTIFHTVVTLEGIYIISFRPEWIGKISKIDKKHVLNDYDISHKKQISFEKYVDIINNKKYKGKSPLFIIKYMKWGDATKEFLIFYAKTGGNCLATDKQFNMHKNNNIYKIL